MYKELVSKLHSAQDYRTLEQSEREYKKLLLDLADRQQYQDILDLSFSVGFTMKQKSYGVKCSLPTGYSIFILNPNEGFSYQRHETHKIELFHFIKPDELTLCYLAPYDKFLETNAVQNVEDFHLEKQGEHLKHCFKPEIGDVVLVQVIGDVHTVIGGIFEEFANTSLDQVTRLFDQNKEKKINYKERGDLLAVLKSQNYIYPKRSMSMDKKGEFEFIGMDSINMGNSQIYNLFKTDDLIAQHIKVIKSATIDTNNNWYSIVNVGANSIVISLGDSEKVLDKMDSIVVPPRINVNALAADAHIVVCGIPNKVLMYE